MEANASRLYLSVVTIAEVEEGIARACRHNANRKANRLADWLETCCTFMPRAFCRWTSSWLGTSAHFPDQARAAGLAPGLADLIIAATAGSRGFMVLTRNLRHFRSLSVPSHDPFESLPPDMP